MPDGFSFEEALKPARGDLPESPDADGPARVAPGAVIVSALTGAGLDALRAELAAVLASLWVDVDVVVPYAEGALLARIREQGSVEVEYAEVGAHIVGRVPPAAAAALRRAAGIIDEPGLEEWEADPLADAADDGDVEHDAGVEDEPEPDEPGADAGPGEGSDASDPGATLRDR